MTGFEHMYIKKMASGNREKTYISISSENIKNDLAKEGFSSKEIDIILECFIFSTKKKDLFDSFLIPDDNTIYFIPEIFDFIDPSRAMISLFGDSELDEQKSQIANKGVAFENYISELVKEKKRSIFKKIFWQTWARKLMRLMLYLSWMGHTFFVSVRHGTNIKTLEGILEIKES